MVAGSSPASGLLFWPSFSFAPVKKWVVIVPFFGIERGDIFRNHIVVKEKTFVLIEKTKKIGVIPDEQNDPIFCIL